jgi:hypothetical protein
MGMQRGFGGLQEFRGGLDDAFHDAESLQYGAPTVSKSRQQKRRKCGAIGIRAASVLHKT